MAYGSFEVSNPLGWDLLDTLELLTCLVEQFGPYYKAKLPAGCSAGEEQLGRPSINRSVVNSSEQRHGDVCLEVYMAGQYVG